MYKAFHHHCDGIFLKWKIEAKNKSEYRAKASQSEGTGGQDFSIHIK